MEARYPVKSELVRSLRKELRLSREELCVRAGISGGTLVWAERAGLASEPTLTKLAQALGVDPSALRPARREDAR